LSISAISSPGLPSCFNKLKKYIINSFKYFEKAKNNFVKLPTRKEEK